MNGGEGGCRARAAANMTGGLAAGEDAIDYDVGIPDELRKSVLFDEKEHCPARDNCEADSALRGCEFFEGRVVLGGERVSELEYLCRRSRAGIGTPSQPVQIVRPRLHHPAALRQMLRIIVGRANRISL
jgi:hypothetical protein